VLLLKAEYNEEINFFLNVLCGLHPVTRSGLHPEPRSFTVHTIATRAPVDENILILWRPNFFLLNFSTPCIISNVNITGTKKKR
jgi:hypothetical protein